MGDPLNFDNLKYGLPFYYPNKVNDTLFPITADKDISDGVIYIYYYKIILI